VGGAGAAGVAAGAGEAATKADLAQLEARLSWRLIGVAAVILAAIALK